MARQKKEVRFLSQIIVDTVDEIARLTTALDDQEEFLQKKLRQLGEGKSVLMGGKEFEVRFVRGKYRLRTYSKGKILGLTD